MPNCDSSELQVDAKQVAPSLKLNPLNACEQNSKADIIKCLLNHEPSQLASKLLFECVPFVFKCDIDSYVSWKHRLANLIGVDPREILLVGSACVGFSLDPNRDLPPFSESSDIDLAVVSDYYFTIAWRTLRSTNLSDSKLQPRQRAQIKEHRENYIYWGTIATDRILTLMPFGIVWSKAFSLLSGDLHIGKRTINARLYKDFDSLRSYQLHGIRQIQAKLAEQQLEKGGE